MPDTEVTALTFDFPQGILLAAHWAEWSGADGPLGAAVAHSRVGTEGAHRRFTHCEHREYLRIKGGGVCFCLGFYRVFFIICTLSFDLI